MQSRALLTYIRRVYYPFLLHDPAIPKESPILCAYWAHTQPLLAGMPQAQNSVSVALVIPALAALPSALQELSRQLGETLCTCNLPPACTIASVKSASVNATIVPADALKSTINMGPMTSKRWMHA